MTVINPVLYFRLPKAREVPRAMLIATAGSSRPDRALKYRPIDGILGSFMVVCSLLQPLTPSVPRPLGKCASDLPRSSRSGSEAQQLFAKGAR